MFGGRRTGVLLLVAGAVVGLTSCATPQTCVSWVDYETPQDAFDDAALVVRGTLEPTGATRDVFGVAMPVYLVEVEETYQGDAPERLEITAAPLTCMGEGVSEYPDGVDPLATDDDLLLLLSDAEGGWRTMTPFDGVLPADGMLPFEVPDR